MNKFLELTEEFISHLNIVCDLALKHAVEGGLKAFHVVQAISEKVKQAIDEKDSGCNGPKS